MTLHCRFTHPALSLFCIWHMGAVALYALPPDPTDRVTIWLKENMQSISKPYILGLSQWQQWNLFSPDPTRRMGQSVIERWNGLEWVTIAEFHADSLPWWKKMPLIKTLRRLEEGPTYKPIQERFLRLFCAQSALPDRTTIRFRTESAMIPVRDTPYSIAEWNAWTPEWKEEIVSSLTCSSS